jgi:hypothetical protein
MEERIRRDNGGKYTAAIIHAIPLDIYSGMTKILHHVGKDG